ncbi:MAG: fatty acid desaturase [Candidatus Thermoplasmatota archaeon]|nr:fatty acid desaturase [Candidatus Thermoplasmatota archaeon]
MSEHIAYPSNINIVNTSFLIGMPIIALTSLVYYSINYGIGWFEPIIFVAFYLASGLSITAGYHRLFSHRTHKAAWPLKLFYALFGAAAFQNSAIKWCSDHRRHHLETDKEEDPYSVTRGFFWAHIGWVMVDEGEEIVEKVDDLKADKILAWQDRNIFLIGFLTGILLPALVGFAWIGGIHGFLGGLVYGGFVRVVVVHHATFLINSAAHTWGTQPYSTENTSRDSPLLSFLTFGEGYHNFHHTFQADYRNGHKWYHWDPSKWLIKSASWFGLTRDLHKIPTKVIESRKMKKAFHDNTDGDEIEAQFQEKFTQCMAELRSGFNELIQRRKEYKIAKQSKKSETKTDWKVIKEGHKNRIKLCKVKIAEARSDFKLLVESMKLNNGAKAAVA